MLILKNMAKCIYQVLSGYKARKTPCGLLISRVSSTIINSDVTCKKCKKSMRKS